MVVLDGHLHRVHVHDDPETRYTYSSVEGPNMNDLLVYYSRSVNEMVSDPSAGGRQLLPRDLLGQ